MRRAKIVCTLGPATSVPGGVRALVDAGMDVARINRSHGSFEEHEAAYAEVRKASLESGRAVGVLVDLQGPKIRTGRFAVGPVTLVNGERFTITADPAGLFINNDSGLNAVGNYNSGNDVLVTFTSSNVYAAGAEFYLNNLAGANQNGSITINFSGGATGSAPSSATGSYGFFGINSTTPISSMTVVHDANYFINLANLYSGATPVPEPATGLVLLTGIAGLACARWRKLF